MKNLIILFIVSQNFFLYSQNLIPDGGFEDNKPITRSFNCDYGLHEISYTWRGFGTCQLFRRDECMGNKNFLGVHASAALENFGLEPIQPKEGDFLGAIRLMDYEIKDWREFIYTDIQRQLKEGKLYKISFFVSLSATEDYISNNFGIAFSKDIIEDTLLENPSYPNNPKPNYFFSMPYLKYNGKKFTQLDGWQKVEFYYKAKGDEKNLVIGNFENDENTQVTHIQDCIACRPGVLLYIDDVKFEACDIDDFKFKNDSVVICSNEDYSINLTYLPYYITWYDGDTKKEKKFTKSGNYFLHYADNKCVISDTFNLYKLIKIEQIQNQNLCNENNLPISIPLNYPSHPNNIIKLNNQIISNNQISINKFDNYILTIENHQCKETAQFKIVSLNQNYKIGPNPSDNVLKLHDVIVDGINYTIYDNIGRRIKEGKVTNEINVSELSSGVYHILFHNECINKIKFHKK